MSTDVIRRVTIAASRHHADILRAARAYDPTASGLVSIDRFREALLRASVYASRADLERALAPYIDAPSGSVQYARFLAQFAPVHPPTPPPSPPAALPQPTGTLPDGVGGDSTRRSRDPDAGEGAPRSGIRRYTADAFPPWSEQSPYAVQHTVTAQRALAELRAKLPLHFRSLQDAFMAFDATGTGMVRYQDVARGLARFNLALSPVEMGKLFAYIDIDRDGAVSFKEWQVSFGKAMQPSEGLGIGYAIGQEHDDRLRQRGLTAKPTDAELYVLPELLRRLRAGFSSVRAAFAALDTNGDGFLDRGEFRRVVERHGMSVSEEVIERLLQHFDADGNGKLDYQEFLTWFTTSTGDTLPEQTLPRVMHSPRQRRLVDNSTAALRRHVSPRSADPSPQRDLVVMDSPRAPVGLATSHVSAAPPAFRATTKAVDAVLQPQQGQAQGDQGVSPRLQTPPNPRLARKPQPHQSASQKQDTQSPQVSPQVSPRQQASPRKRDGAVPSSADIRRALSRVDVDGTGHVTATELRSVLSRFGVDIPSADFPTFLQALVGPAITHRLPKSLAHAHAHGDAVVPIRAITSCHDLISRFAMVPPGAAAEKHQEQHRHHLKSSPRGSAAAAPSPPAYGRRASRSPQRRRAPGGSSDAPASVNAVSPALIAFVSSRWKVLRRAFALVDGARRKTVTQAQFCDVLLQAGAVKEGFSRAAIVHVGKLYAVREGARSRVRYNDFIAGCLRS